MMEGSRGSWLDTLQVRSLSTSFFYYWWTTERLPWILPFPILTKIWVNMGCSDSDPVSWVTNTGICQEAYVYVYIYIGLYKYIYMCVYIYLHWYMNVHNLTCSLICQIIYYIWSKMSRIQVLILPCINSPPGYNLHLGRRNSILLYPLHLVNFLSCPVNFF